MTPRQQLDAFLHRFNRDVARQAKAALTKLRRLTPGAIELVYDNYNALVVGFCATERSSDGIVSIAVCPKFVALCFIQKGPRLPDPTEILRGSGTVARHIRLESPKDLDRPDVLALIAAARSIARTDFDPSQRRRLVIRSISSKQRPRRPAPT